MPMAILLSWAHMGKDDISCSICHCRLDMFDMEGVDMDATADRESVTE